MRSYVDRFLTRLSARDGVWVLSSFFLVKVVGLILTLAVVRMIDQVDYGNFTYAMSAIRFMVPFIGFGVFQGLLRFGAQEKGYLKKNDLLQYSMNKGLVLSVILSLLVLLAAPFLTSNIQGALPYLNILSLYLIGLLFFELAKSYSRLVHLNKLFSVLNVSHILLALVIGIIGAWYYGAIGFAVSVVLAPLIIGAYFLRRFGMKLFRKKLLPLSIDKKTFWKYSVYVSLGGVAAELIYHVDILSIGNLLPNAEQDVAGYRIMSLLVLSTCFIPNAFISSDFVLISSKESDYRWLKDYSRKFVLTFFIVGLLFWGLLFLIQPLIPILVGQVYEEYTYLLGALGMALPFIMGLRIPLGNMLNAVGKAHWNIKIAVATLILNIVLNYFFIQNYGILGAALATALVHAISGLLNLIAFRYYLRTIR